jgi:exopolyphosphatase/guanosine-5'-triphosphate,3'-diphosphate pyrophosphatase
LLASLVGNHRRKLEGMSLDALAADWRRPIFRLIVLLRLAVVLHRARSSAVLPPLRLTAGNDRLEVEFPKCWFSANPLTHADLILEQEFLAARGFELAFQAGD